MAWPPDVADGQIIAAAHINAIKNSVQIWQGDVNANGFLLSDVNVISPRNITGTAGIGFRILGYQNDLYIAADGLGRIALQANGVVRMRVFEDGVVDVTDAFVTAPGTLRIKPQSSGGEGGEIELIDFDYSPGWKIDSDALRNFRIFRGSSIIFQIDNGTAAIHMFLGGSLKTLSVDGSGFVKAT